MLIRRMFPDIDGEPQEANEHGLYTVRVCKDGEWHDIRLDDYVPCGAKAGPICAKVSDVAEHMPYR